MSGGKPIIAAVQGDVESIIKDAQAGIVCPSEDSQAMIREIITLYNMEAKDRDRMGENGRNYAIMYFKKDIIMKKIEHMLSEVKR